MQRNSSWTALRNRWWTTVSSLLLLTLIAPNAVAAGISVVGLFPGKALVSQDGGAPKTLSVGQKTVDGFTLISVSSESAVFDLNGKRSTLRIGQAFNAPAAGDAANTVTLSADSRGHYFTVGAINGKAARFMVDTGASVVAFGTRYADQIGLAYRTGRSASFSTANGARMAHLVRLDSVRIGGITLENVEAAVTEGMNHSDDILLGMSFLSRLSMQRDANTLRLSRNESGATAADSRARITLTEARGGMFKVSVKINGVALPFVVDTGATSISIDTAMAQQIGLQYQNGRPVNLSTANGVIRGWLVKLDSVTAGPITLYGVEATVSEGPGTGGTGLLGMSFLNRVEMKRDGENLTLIKRF